jgi:hypothetical protein
MLRMLADILAPMPAPHAFQPGGTVDLHLQPRDQVTIRGLGWGRIGWMQTDR